MPVVQEFGKRRQEDYKCPASLNYSRTIIKQNNKNHRTALQEENMLACATDSTFGKSEKESLNTYPRRISTLKTSTVSEKVKKHIPMECGTYAKDEGSPGKCKMIVTTFFGAVEAYLLPLIVEGLNSITIL